MGLPGGPSLGLRGTLGEKTVTGRPHAEAPRAISRADDRPDRHSRRTSIVPAITREEVAHIARLARIDLTEAELDHLAPQLADILASVAQVSEVAAEDIPPTSHPLPLTNVFRPDEVTSGLTADEALAGAPVVDGERAVEDDRFRVPRILDEEA
jgi:aspartyl-tRNA(Asn)/glutamyl-tRNA(Gln) amidotransferase subunit C